MVDMADIVTVQATQHELDNITRALEILDAGSARITYSTFATPIDQEPGQSVQVDTSFIAYPEQMLTAIADQLRSRQSQLSEQLDQLGVTGVPTTPKRASRR